MESHVNPYGVTVRQLSMLLAEMDPTMMVCIVHRKFIVGEVWDDITLLEERPEDSVVLLYSND